jgi:hypothetical protein
LYCFVWRIRYERTSLQFIYLFIILSIIDIHLFWAFAPHTFFRSRESVKMKEVDVTSVRITSVARRDSWPWNNGSLGLPLARPHHRLPHKCTTLESLCARPIRLRTERLRSKRGPAMRGQKQRSDVATSGPSEGCPCLPTLALHATLATDRDLDASMTRCPCRSSEPLFSTACTATHRRAVW